MGSGDLGALSFANSSTEELAAGLERIAALLEVSRQSTESMPLEVLLRRLADRVGAFLAVETCTIFVYDEQADALYTRLAEGTAEGTGDGKSFDLRLPRGKGIAGAVFATGESLSVPDAYADARFFPDVDRHTGFRTRDLLASPIFAEGPNSKRCVGVVEALNKKNGPFDERDRALLEALAQHIAPPLINAELRQEVARARDEERQMLELTTVLSQELQLLPLLQKIMDAVRVMLEVDRATLFMYDPRKHELWTRVSQDESMAAVRFPADRGIAGSVFTSGETVRLDDVYADPRFNREIDRKTGYRTHTMLCMPVVSKAGAKIGVMQVLNKLGSGRTSDGTQPLPVPFRKRDESRLQAFCAQASIAIENAQLFDEVVRIKNYNESILRSMSNGVITVDVDGRVVTINGAARRLLRLPQSGVSSGAASGVASGVASGAASDLSVNRQVESLLADRNPWIAESIEAVKTSGREQVAMDAEILLGVDFRRGDPVEDSDSDERTLNQSQERATVNLTAVPLTDAKEHRIGALLMMEDITQEKRLKSTMARYMTKEVLDKLLGEGEAALGGKMLQATVLFTDIRGFTTISERLGPQATVSMLNEYFTVMVDRVLERGGVLDKYIGDAIMAVFGVPFAGPDDADHAVEAAIGMMHGLRDFNAERARGGHDPVLMGVGVNTEEVVSGNIGSLKRMDYTVIGDGVNLASRLESANKHYGTQVLISEFTLRQLRGSYQLREVDKLRVKGKQKPVGVYEVLDHYLDEEFPRREQVIALYDHALANYRRRDFSAARRGFESALEIHAGDETSKLYVQRCSYFLEHTPAPDWDGVWVMQDK